MPPLQQAYPWLFNQKSPLYISPAFETYVVAAVLISGFLACICILLSGLSPERRMTGIRIAGLVAIFAMAVSCIGTLRFMSNVRAAHEYSIPLPGQDEFLYCYLVFAKWFLLSTIAIALSGVAFRSCGKAMEAERAKYSSGKALVP